MEIRAPQKHADSHILLDSCLQPRAELERLPSLGRTTCSCLNNNLLHCLSPSLSMLLYGPTSSCPVCTLLLCLSLNLWEQYRVSLWVGRPRGPGWFRSDGRRKLLQEIPNCQTHILTHTQFTTSLSPKRETKAPAGVKKPSTPLPAPSVSRTDSTALLYVVQYSQVC